MELPPLQLFRASSATSAGTSATTSACRTCRPSPRWRCRAPARATGSRAILANKIPKKRGRIALCHMLTKNGGVRAEFTVYEHAPGRFYLVSAGAYERHDHDYLQKLAAEGRQRDAQLPDDPAWACSCWPARTARKLLAEAHRHRPLQRRLPLAHRQADLGRPRLVRMRCASTSSASSAGSSTTRSSSRTRCSTCLMDAGKEFGIKPYGIRAMSVAVDREELPPDRRASCRSSTRPTSPASTASCIPTRASSSAATRWSAGRAKGFELAVRDDGSRRRDDDVRRARLRADLSTKGKLVGRATNGGYGWRCGKSLALAMVRPEQAALGTELEIKILGKIHAREGDRESPWDPENARLRG